jgi:hypothetical protein
MESIKQFHVQMESIKQFAVQMDSIKEFDVQMESIKLGVRGENKNRSELDELEVNTHTHRSAIRKCEQRSSAAKLPDYGSSYSYHRVTKHFNVTGEFINFKNINSVHTHVVW